MGSYWKSLHCWNVFRNFKQIKLMMMMTEKDCGQNDRVSGRLHIKKLHESEVIKRLEWETLLFIDIVRLSGMDNFDGRRMDIWGEKVRNRRNDRCSARTGLIEMPHQQDKWLPCLGYAVKAQRVCVAHSWPNRSVESVVKGNIKGPLGSK